MRVLLDTYVLIRAATDAYFALPKKLQALLADSDTEKLVSAISLTEIAMKSQIGKLAL